MVFKHRHLKALKCVPERTEKEGKNGSISETGCLWLQKKTKTILRLIQFYVNYTLT